jgi:ATP-dependent DNA helicase DinG
MGFIVVRVCGKTFPHRNELKNTLGLEYDFRQKDFKGAFPEDSQRIIVIEKFCKKNRLSLFVDGEERYSPMEAKKKEKKQTKLTLDEMDNLDEFNLGEWLPILEQAADESDIGTVGVVKWNEPSEIGAGFKEVGIDHTTPQIQFDFDGLSKDTHFHPLRDIQKQVLGPMMEAVKGGYRNIVLECPTGSGKSALAKTIAQAFGVPSYIVTHLKGLQAQYLKEMPYMKSVMGRGNYDCLLDVEAGCDDVKVAQEALEAATDKSPQTCSAALAPCKYAKGFKCTKMTPKNPLGQYDFTVNPDSLCSYFSALTKAQNSMYFVGNTAYMMAINKSGKVLPQRPFLIVDEAHQLSNNMMSFHSLTVSQRMLEKLFRLPTQNDISNAKSDKRKEEYRKQRETIFKVFDGKGSFGVPKLKSMTLTTPMEERKKSLQTFGRYLFGLMDEIKRKMKDKDAQTKYDKKELSYASNCIARIEDLLGSIATDWENWVYQVDDNNDYPMWVAFKPLKVADYSEELLLGLGQQRIFMSGTILDYEIFGRELGLKPDETTFIKVEYSPFPEQNRPIYTHIKGGKLSRKDRGLESYKKCADAIATIASKYPDQKGLILPFTNDIEDGIVEALKDNHPLVYARLRQHSKIPKERDAVFREFEDEQNNEILISTYANQGFDGKMVDFTVIAKIPFGPLGDIQVKAKAENDPKWYQMMTAVELAQMAGRCVRSDKDVGHTYIIDPSFMFHFERGMKNNPLARILPPYVATAIINNR